MRLLPRIVIALAALTSVFASADRTARADEKTPAGSPSQPPRAEPLAAAPDPGVSSQRAPDLMAPVNVEVSERGHRFTYITLGPETCELPCRLSLQPGIYPVIASGKSNLATHVLLPPEASRVEIVDVSPVYRIAGAIMVPFGAIMAASMWSLLFACHGNDVCEVSNLIAWPILGGATFFTGIGFLAYAASRSTPELRVSPLGKPTAQRAPRIRLTGLGVAPTPTGAAGSLAFEF